MRVGDDVAERLRVPLPVRDVDGVVEGDSELAPERDGDDVVERDRVPLPVRDGEGVEDDDRDDDNALDAETAVVPLSNALTDTEELDDTLNDALGLSCAATRRAPPTTSSASGRPTDGGAPTRVHQANKRATQSAAWRAGRMAADRTENPEVLFRRSQMRHSCTSETHRA